MSFLTSLNQHITATKFNLPYAKPRSTNWPTEASFKNKDGKVLGKCMRKLWYDYNGIPISNPVDEKGQSIFDMGDMIEEWYTEKAKRMGIWVADNVRYFDDERSITSEIDLLIRENEQLVGVEIKSGYGHFAAKEVSAFPKIDHLMQVCINLDFLNRVLYGDPSWSCRYYIEYFMRDSCLRYEHIIELDQTILPDGKTLTIPVVNSVATDIINLEGVYARYEELNVIRNMPTPPKPDFTYAYDKEEVEKKFKAGEISKSKYLAWQRGKKTISDWNCLYCTHLDNCWPEKRRALKLHEEEVEEEV